MSRAAQNQQQKEQEKEKPAEEFQEVEVLNQEEEDVEGRTQPLAKLKTVAKLSSNDMKMLEEAGYYTVEAVAFAPKRAIERIRGLWRRTGPLSDLLFFNHW